MSYHILVVEDEPLQQKLINSVLKEAGYRVTVVAKAFDAIKELSIKSSQYDLILSDVGLPDFSGIELARLIKKHLKNSIPILGYSSNSDNKEACLAIGMSDFLCKPAAPQKLNQMILENINTKMVDGECIVDQLLNCLHLLKATRPYQNKQSYNICEAQ